MTEQTTGDEYGLKPGYETVGDINFPAPSIGEEPSDEAINAARVAMYANKIGTAHADYKAAEAILKAAYRIDFPSTTPPSGEADG